TRGPRAGGWRGRTTSSSGPGRPATRRSGGRAPPRRVRRRPWPRPSSRWSPAATCRGSPRRSGSLRRLLLRNRAGSSPLHHEAVGALGGGGAGDLRQTPPALAGLVLAAIRIDLRGGGLAGGHAAT